MGMVLIGQTSEELEHGMVSLGEPPYRGRQIARWIYRQGATCFEHMTDLPAGLRERLAAEMQISSTSLSLQQPSRDGVIKCLLRLQDNQQIESVLLPYEERVSVCLSTQVGCAMGCQFCATAQGGYTRNLSAGEIVEQFLTLQQLAERKITHIVYMGMGEPLLNLENALKSMQLFHEEVGISMRRMTVSTVGIVPKINELAEQNLPITLAVSLHAPDDETRRSFMPVARKWDINSLLTACRNYFDRTGRRVTFEYLLLKEFNDTPDQAIQLGKLLKGFPCLVNLIPFNYVATPRGFQRPEPERVRAFRGILEQAGINVTQRVERGHEIAAACGQLRGQHQGKPIAISRGSGEK
jgi:23S rRNA (adenine2503-C2)-methyltransferase